MKFRNRLNRQLLFTAGITAAAGISACKTERPNIVLILTDQQFVNAMSITGNHNLLTPNMDRLAKSGVRFTHAYRTSPVSGPSRATIVTGMMPSETGVNYNGDSIRNEIKTIGEILREEGYYTVWGGKWHLPESYPQRADARPEDKKIRGFDMLPFWEATQKRWILGAETDPPLTEAVTGFLKNYNKSKPLFLAVSYHNPHDICFHPRKAGWVTENDSLLEIRYYGFKYRLPDPIGIHPDQIDNLPPLPINFTPETDEPQFITDKRLFHETYGVETKFAWEYSDKEWQSYLYSYYRLTELVDIEIGKLLDALTEYGYDDNTLLIFTSDHGDGAAGHKWAAKLSLYEESTNVPFIIRFPAKIKGGEVDDRNLITLADIVPTLCDYAGITTKTGFAGKSMRPALENKNHKLRDNLIVELCDYKPDTTRIGRMVRTSGFKYNYYSTGRNNEQLFDMIADKGEMNNLAYDPEFKDQLEEHRNLLKDWEKSRNKIMQGK